MDSLYRFIRSKDDFPEKGIVFRDITPLLLAPEASGRVLDEFCRRVQGMKIDKVAAIEARGFFFGPQIARRLGAGFIPIRKEGKLPFPSIREKYVLEYGYATIEMHRDAIREGETVLLHDDVLATGGTAGAAIRMIEKAGGRVVMASFLLEIASLKGREALEKTVPVHALLRF